MPKYKKLSGNYEQIAEAVGMDKTIYLPPADTKRAYRRQLLVDRARDKAISFDQTATQTKYNIYNVETHDTLKYYNQGDFTARFSELYLLHDDESSSRLVNTQDLLGGAQPKFSFGFSYIDDQGIPCGLTVIKIVGQYLDPDSNIPKYAVTHIHNIHAPAKDRQVTFLCDDELLSALTQYDKKIQETPDLVQEENITEQHLFAAIQEKLGSVKISQLVKSMFTGDENAAISEQKFMQLCTRVLPYGLDNRDLKIAQFERLIKTAKKINPTTAQRLSKEKQESVDFFEDSYYQGLLLNLISDATRTGDKHLVSETENLYLESLIAETYFKTISTNEENAEKILTSGFTKQKLIDIWRKFAKDRKPNMDYSSFTQKSNQFYKQLVYHDLVDKLEVGIHYSLHPEAQHEALRLKKLFETPAFSERPQHQQYALLKLLLQLTYFVEHAEIEQYNKLIPLYQALEVQIPAIQTVVANENLPNQTEYDLQIKELEHMIGTCKQAFVKQEMLKRLAGLKAIQLSEFLTENQIVLVDFLTQLISFTQMPSEDSYNNLMQFYPKFGLNIPDKDKFLQAPEFAYFNQMIANKTPKSYRFDPQARIVYDTIDHMNRPVTLSVDISDPAVQKKFETTVLEALKKETSNNENDAQLILQAYTKIENKNSIVPLQQQIHIHISTLAQHYQLALAENSFDDQERLELVTQTVEEIYQESIKVFARGLYKAKPTLAQGPNPSLDINKLNEVLHEQSEHLKNKSKSILIKKIKEKITQKRNNHTRYNATQHQPVPNAILSPNKKLKLATWIQTEHLPTAGFSCQQIKTFSMNASEELTAEIPRLRIQTSALMISENLSDKTPFDERFHKGLEAVRSTYAFKNTNFTHYLFNGPYEQDDNRSDNIALSLAAAHEYNRNNKDLCLVQAISLSNESRTLGYHRLDWSGIGNEATLMAEMALCAQMDTLNPADYQRFLEPPQSLLSRIYRTLFKSTLFVNTHEGAKTKAQIQSLKTQWQQHQLNNIEETSPNNLLKHGLQKLMAYDLHFDSEHAVLVQTLSLALQNTDAILNVNASSHSPALVLGYTQAFDALDKFAVLKTLLGVLAQANDKQSTIASAQSIMQYLNQNCLNQQYKDAFLPMTAEEQETILTETQAMKKAAIPSVSTQLNIAYQTDRRRHSSKPHAGRRHSKGAQPTPPATQPTAQSHEHAAHTASKLHRR